jgi:hypothetical protein
VSPPVPPELPRAADALMALGQALDIRWAPWEVQALESAVLISIPHELGHFAHISGPQFPPVKWA